jgi:hypothetical protein
MLKKGTGTSRSIFFLGVWLEGLEASPLFQQAAAAKPPYMVARQTVLSVMVGFDRRSK